MDVYPQPQYVKWCDVIFSQVKRYIKMVEIKELFFESRQELRNWFIKNHEQESSFNMLFYKKHLKTKCIEYSDAVEEALCFGWIDGMIKRLDEDKYIRRFSKRNRKSRWSPTNIKRMKKVIKEGKAIQNAIDLFENAEKDGLFQTKSDRRGIMDIPEILIDKLKEDKKVEQFFLKLNTREKEAYSHFISDAKKEETRQKRLNEMIAKLKEGWRMPYFRPKNKK